MAKTAIPKIKDVARVAGVSAATVSRVLNHPETVAEPTRQAVLEATRRTGYRINLAARNLRRRRTGSIVVLVPNLGNPFFSAILAGIEMTFARHGLNVVVFDTQQPDVPPELVLEYLHNSRSDGIISLDGGIPETLLKNSGARSSLPPIIFACEWDANGDYPSVRADNFEGARMAVRHLAALGHRKIGHLQGPPGNVLTEARRAGMTAAICELGLELRREWFLGGSFALESGARAAIEWIDLKERPSALFCASDQIAFGLISELHRNGVYVPRDLSVIGFDDIDIASRFIPPLTTIRQPRTQLGAAAAELLLDHIEGRRDTGEPVREILPVELVVRGSTAQWPQ